MAGCFASIAGSINSSAAPTKIGGLPRQRPAALFETRYRYLFDRESSGRAPIERADIGIGAVSIPANRTCTQAALAQDPVRIHRNRWDQFLCGTPGSDPNIDIAQPPIIGRN